MPPLRDVARLHILAGQHFAMAADAMGGGSFVEGDAAGEVLATACGLAAKDELGERGDRARDLGRSVARSVARSPMPSLAPDRQHSPGRGVRDARDYGGAARGAELGGGGSHSLHPRAAEVDVLGGGGHFKTHRAGRKHCTAQKRAAKAAAVSASLAAERDIGFQRRHGRGPSQPSFPPQHRQQPPPPPPPPPVPPAVPRRRVRTPSPPPQRHSAGRRRSPSIVLPRRKGWKRVRRSDVGRAAVGPAVPPAAAGMDGPPPGRDPGEPDFVQVSEKTLSMRMSQLLRWGKLPDGSL